MKTIAGFSLIYPIFPKEREEDVGMKKKRFSAKYKHLFCVCLFVTMGKHPGVV